MTKAVSRDPIYRRRCFPAEVIELCVRWYVTYRPSYRDLVAMMAERGIVVSHTTILRWVLRYVPEFEKRWARYARPVNPSWRMDETAVSVRGGNHYLYRAVDRHGKSVEHLLCADRTRDAAQAFFRKAVTTHAGKWPRTDNLDGNLASHLALRMLGEEDPRWKRILVRNRRYLNNIVEQDHRAIKSRCASMLGFKSFGTAAITLAGIELAHRIRKGQFSFTNGGDRGAISLKQLWDRAIAGADATNCEPQKEPSGAPTANAPELTASRKRRRYRRIPSEIRHIRPVRQARKFSEGGGLYLLTDKSLEVYKFFVNALYVAMTRAVENLYLIESDLEHPLLRLLGLSSSGDLQVAAQRSSIEDWQKEARRLELHGKQEQAEAIGRTILKTTAPPWQVFDEPHLRSTLDTVFRDCAQGEKQKQRLYEWAAVHNEPVLAMRLAEEANYGPAYAFRESRSAVARKHWVKYAANYFKDILRECEQYGLEHRTQANLTPLMAACAAGNVPLVEALLERGADSENTDHYGRNALHWAMLAAFRDPKFAKGPFPAVYERVAPACIDVKAGQRLVRIDRHQSEYVLFQTLWALVKERFAYAHRGLGGAFDSESVLQAWEHFPASVLRPERNRRQHVSAVLARNEVSRDYAYNRALFMRVSHGFYVLSPSLALRSRKAEGEVWRPLRVALNLPLIKEFAIEHYKRGLDRYFGTAGLSESPGEPSPGAKVAAQVENANGLEAAPVEEEHPEDRTLCDEFNGPNMPKWGTPEARMREMLRLQRRIDELRRRKKEE